MNLILRNIQIICGSYGINTRDKVHRGILLGNFLSPLLRVPAINGLLRILTEEEIDTIGYAVHVVIHLREKVHRREIDSICYVSGDDRSKPGYDDVFSLQ